MARSFSSGFLKHLMSQSMDDAVLPLLTLEHDDFDNPIRVVSRLKNESVTSNGKEFIAWPFEFDFPGDQSAAGAVFNITIDAVDPTIQQAILEVSGPIKVTLDFVLVSDPNTIEISLTNLVLTNISGDIHKITGECTMKALFTEGFGRHARPSTHKGFPWAA